MITSRFAGESEPSPLASFACDGLSGHRGFVVCRTGQFRGTGDNHKKHEQNSQSLGHSGFLL
jgi:hypothetical protein